MLPIRIGLFDVTNKNWVLNVANEKLGFDVFNKKLSFDIANKNWVLNVANEKLGFGGMRYVQWAHKANFGFCQALKEKKKKKGPNMWFLGFMVMVYIVTQFGNEILNTCGLIW